MEQIGKIKEVFIPEQDVMNSKEIGFVIELDNEEITLIEEQDEYNSKILKGSKVIVSKCAIDGKNIIDLELYEGEEDE